MRCSKCEHHQVVLVGVGLILLALGAAFLLTVPDILHRQIAQHVLLVNGSQSYAEWVEPSMPIYLQMWVFNVTNPLGVIEGQKPHLHQRGPYTYREYRQKMNIVHNANGTVTYSQLKYYVFDREMSVGSEFENFTTLNIPLLTLAEGIRWNATYRRLLASLLSAIMKEDLMVTKSVHDIVWGYQDPLLHLGKYFVPSLIYTDITGVLAGKNNTSDGVYTVFTGETDTSKLGVIDRFNGSRQVNFWTTKYANMINGSDGTVCPPDLKKSTVLHLFSTDICRSVYGEYIGDTSTPQGIPLWRYRGPKSVMASVSSNPDAAGFCTPRGNCLGDGVLNVSTCQMIDHFHIPVIVSLPHFYQGDPKYRHAVEGLDPSPGSQYATDIDIEPNSGLVLQIKKQLQINVFLEPVPDIIQTAGVRTLIFPILWFNESAQIDDSLASRLQGELMIPLYIVTALQYVLLGLGVVFILLGFITSLVSLRSKKVNVIVTEDPHDSLNADNTEDTDNLLSNNVQ